MLNWSMGMLTTLLHHSMMVGLFAGGAIRLLTQGYLMTTCLDQEIQSPLEHRYPYRPNYGSAS